MLLKHAPKSFHLWEKVLSWIFKYPYRIYALKESKKIQSLSTSSELLNDFAERYFSYNSSHGMICRVTKDPEDLARLISMFEEVYEHFEDPMQMDIVTGELIAKVLAYRELEEGARIPIPSLNLHGERSLEEYHVEKILDLWKGVHAFGLKPKHPELFPSLLVFRGTDRNFTTKSGRISILSDFDPDGPGQVLFEKGRENLRVYLENQNQACLTRLYGHSLGGAITLYTMVSFPELLSKHSQLPSYAFNFPGINEKLCKAWSSIEDEKKPAFSGFVARGDVVSKFGYLFGDVTELSLENRLPPITAHELLHLAQDTCYLQPIDIAKENDAESRRFFSTLHMQTSTLIYHIGLKHLFKKEK